MSYPRHLWSGAWREDSARARREAEEAAARQRALAGPSDRDPETDSPTDVDLDIPEDRAGRPRRRMGRGALALTVLAVLGILGGVFTVGTLVGGDDDGTEPLPAVA